MKPYTDEDLRAAWERWHESAMESNDEPLVKLLAESYAVKRELTRLHGHVKLAEHKLDQYLQGQGPGTVRAGIALKELRSALLLFQEEPCK